YRSLWDKSAPISRRIAELSASVRKLPRHFTSPFGRNEFILSTAARLTPCLYWPAPPAGGLPPAIPRGWTARRGFPALVPPGQVDAVPSVREAHEVAARSPRSSLYVVPDRGH